MRQSRRVVVGVALLILLVGMGVHYGMVAEEHWPYPDEDELVTDPAGHVGEDVFLFGTVTEVDGDARTATVRIEATTESFELQVSDVDTQVREGATVQVLGTLSDERRVSAQRIVVVNATRGVEYYKYGVSAIGAVVVLIGFFRYWRINTDELSFEVRQDG